GSEPDRVVAALGDAGPAHERVGIRHLDVPGARAVRVRRDRPCKSLPAQLGVHRHDLAWLDVRAEPDDELRVAVDQLVVHGLSTISRRQRTNAGTDWFSVVRRRATLARVATLTEQWDGIIA